MSSASPQDLDSRLVQRLLDSVKSARRADNRIELLSAQLLGRPYQSNPLIGSAQLPEAFTARTDAYDCVTFIETVVALARSRQIHAFVKTLRYIRYASGDIAWIHRNHYMSEWIRQNLRSGWIRRVPALKGSVRKDRILDVVPGLSARRTAFTCIPKNRLLKAADRIRTGDLIFFVSTRKSLDVFHCGILVRNGQKLLVRHASRSRGAVVEQDLSEFLKQNRMAGVIIVRPADQPGASAEAL
jgi:hypothetical protein